MGLPNQCYKVGIIIHLTDESQRCQAKFPRPHSREVAQLRPDSRALVVRPLSSLQSHLLLEGDLPLPQASQRAAKSSQGQSSVL